MGGDEASSGAVRTSPWDLTALLGYLWFFGQPLGDSLGSVRVPLPLFNLLPPLSVPSSTSHPRFEWCSLRNFRARRFGCPPRQGFGNFDSEIRDAHQGSDVPVGVVVASRRPLGNCFGGSFEFLSFPFYLLHSLSFPSFSSPVLILLISIRTVFLERLLGISMGMFLERLLGTHVDLGVPRCCTSLGETQRIRALN